MSSSILSITIGHTGEGRKAIYLTLLRFYASVVSPNDFDCLRMIDAEVYIGKSHNKEIIENKIIFSLSFL